MYYKLKLIGTHVNVTMVESNTSFRELSITPTKKGSRITARPRYPKNMVNGYWRNMMESILTEPESTEWPAALFCHSNSNVPLFLS